MKPYVPQERTLHLAFGLNYSYATSVEEKIEHALTLGEGEACGDVNSVYATRSLSTNGLGAADDDQVETVLHLKGRRRRK
jgi:hypothetical protein